MLRLINPAVLYDSHGETNHGNRMILCLYFVELFVWQDTVHWVILFCNKLHGISIMSFREVIQASIIFLGIGTVLVFCKMHTYSTTL